MNEKIDVLDHGLVRLVDFMGSDLSVVRNARVSYDAEWRVGEDTGSDHRLIRFLYTHGHNTPFESVTMTFEVKAPIMVFRQWHRHRTQSYNELSARYRPLPKEYYIPDTAQIGVQSAHNKQMRDVAAPEDMTEVQHNRAEKIRSIMKRSCEHSYAEYELLLSMGTPRELARGVLPFFMYSHMFTTLNLHNCLRFLMERTDETAQYEIQVYAKAMLTLLEPYVPTCVGAFREEMEKVAAYRNR